jgi:hypothetical protein
MARRARSSANGESVQGYFRKILEEEPKLLKKRSNAELYERWLKDHPGQTEVPLKVRQGLSNLKSVMRNRRRRRKRMQNGEAAAAGPARRGAPRGGNALVNLESQIDEALVMARQHESLGLEDVIRLLRTARNRVIVRMG